MTEDEAMTKWCPFARCGSPESPGYTMNRQVGRDAVLTPPESRCIASACMAWRGGAKQKFKDARTGVLHDVDLTGHGSWVAVDGFCGLVGGTSHA